tara:strand:- start:2029 stop:2517 length:489 start_codon:yes stop_codon:yes gene_type:complete
MYLSKLKIFFGILIVLSVSRFIPHPPNFTSLIALSFYIPAFFGLKYIFLVLLAFIFTDIIIGFHTLILFTWGSVFVIGLISKFLNNNFKIRIIGTFLSCFIFFIISNFGVWVNGFYGYTFEGLINCYTLALPFFGQTLSSTILYALIIEAIFVLYKFKKLKT